MKQPFWQDETLYMLTLPQALACAIVPCATLGRTFQFGEGWHSNENAVRFWTPSPRVPKEADARCYRSSENELEIQDWLP